MNDFAALVGAQLRDDLAGLAPRLRARSRREPAAALAGALSIADLRERARRRTPRPVFDFVDGAAHDEVALARAAEDLAALSLAPRVLVDVATVDTARSLLGERLSLPVIGAPTGFTGLTHPDGEVAVARALHAAGSVYCVSSMASRSVEEVGALDGPVWFQLYMLQDRGRARELVARAAAARMRALVLTVDVPRLGVRERDHRNGFTIPPRMTASSLWQGLRHPGWSARFVRTPRLRAGNAVEGGGDPGASFQDFIDHQFDPRVSFADLEWLRAEWDGPLVVKGVLRADDAARCVALGADGVVVSNHGGRQLDGARSPIAALPEVVDAVGADATVLLDGGVRRGTDVVKALALGAAAVLSGRALVYGLGAGGEAGVARALEILRAELELAMALCGAPSLDALDASLVVP